MAQQRYYASTAKQASLAASVDSLTTSITLDLVTGFPGSVPYTLALDPDTNKEELVLVTAVSGTVLTVSRGQDGTVAVAHTIGATVRHVASGQDFNQFSAHIGSTSTPTTSGVHGVTGNVVGTTDTQTLTSKTFTGTKSIGFDTAAPGTAALGVVAWNDTYGTLEYKLKGNNVTLQVGQEELARVINAEASTLTDGQVVYLYGAQGNLPSVKLASASTEASSTRTFGVVTESITAGQAGYVTLIGMVHDLNTSSFTEGSLLWLSPTTPGAMTTTKPTAPNHAVVVGICVRSHATVGQIYVNVANGYELDELHDVSVGTKTNGDVLMYNASTGLWEDSAAFKANFSAGGFKITNVGTATDNGDAVNKLYIDTVFGSTTSAAASATAAANSASSAATSASSAATSATSASTSASSAATSATSAANSYTSVQNQVGSGILRDLGSITEADTTTGTWISISTEATAAANSAIAAAGSASSSATSASSASTSASSAATSASSASTSATSAATSASSAATSASSAAVSATSAAAAASSAVPLATVTTKGDLIVASGNAAVARLAAGTDGYILTAASTAANGLTWAVAPSGLPSQSGNSGKYLTTNGSTASWAAITTDPLPQVMMMMGA